MIQHRDDDITDVIPLSTLPTAREIAEALADYPEITVVGYSPYADIRKPWLLLHTPDGIVKLYDQLDLREFRIMVTTMGVSKNTYWCPTCRSELVRRAPAGSQYCSKCYKRERRMIPMVWRGR